MRLFRSNILSMLCGGAILAALSVPASASIIYDFQGVTPSGINFDWKYNARLSADQKLTASGTDFAVIYDFMGVISASTSGVVSGLTVTTAVESLSPVPLFQTVTDSNAINNVDSTIKGDLNPGVLTVIYTLDVISASGTRGLNAIQSAQAIKNAPGTGTDGTVAGNSVFVEAPGSFARTPEPATMLLFGSGLIGLGLLRKRIAKS